MIVKVRVVTMDAGTPMASCRDLDDIIWMRHHGQELLASFGAGDYTIF